MDLEKELKQLFSNIEDTGLDVSDVIDIFNKYQPTQFKVATKNSPEVLECPYTISDNLRIQKSGFTVAHNTVYDRATSISQDRLELNKLRVEHEKLKEPNTVKEMLELDFIDNLEPKEINRIFNHFNKQLKEHKEVVAKLKRYVPEHPYYQITSKLNKD